MGRRQTVRDRKVLVMENAKYVNSTIRYLAFRNRVVRQVHNGSFWVDDSEWEDTRGPVKDLVDAERRAKSYATLETFELGKARRRHADGD